MRLYLEMDEEETIMFKGQGMAYSRRKCNRLDGSSGSRWGGEGGGENALVVAVAAAAVAASLSINESSARMSLRLSLRKETTSECHDDDDESIKSGE